MAAPPPNQCTQTATLNINWVEPNPTYTYEIRYRKVITPVPAWTVVTDDDPPHAIVVEACYNYEVEVRTDCGGGSFSAWVPTIATRIEGQVYISTTAPGLTITNITGITGYAFTGPLLAGSPVQSEGGTHDGGTFGIGVVFSGTAFLDTNIRLYKNGIQEQCVFIPQGTGASFIFNNKIFSPTDEIKISMGTGFCI